jgi:hypothetical protein
MEILEPRSPRMYGKRARLSGASYELVVARLEWTHWYWMGFILLNGEVLNRTRHHHNRLEAMKDAYCLAHMDAGIRDRDYPERYWAGWRRLKVPDSDSVMYKQERLDRRVGPARARVQ